LVLGALRRAGHANAATNDMYVEEVLPLAPDDAQHLALALFRGERLVIAAPEETARALAAAADHAPFFIHRIVDEWTRSAGPFDPTTVEVAVAEALLNPQDAWHLSHYHERLNLYYAAMEQPVALALLDALAVQPDLGVDDLQQALLVRPETAQVGRE